MTNLSCRVERLTEAVLLIKRALRSESLNFSGQHYTVTDYTGMPSPVQPSLPIMIGGGGPRILRLAGREADIVGIAANLGPSQPDLGQEYASYRIEQKLQWVREGAGGRFSDIELQTMVPIATVTNDTEGALAQAGGRFGLTPEEATDALLLLVGSVEQMAETLIVRRERLGISYYVFSRPSYGAAGSSRREASWRLTVFTRKSQRRLALGNRRGR